MIGRKARKYPSNKSLDGKYQFGLWKKFEDWFVNIPYLCTFNPSMPSNWWWDLQPARPFKVADAMSVLRESLWSHSEATPSPSWIHGSGGTNNPINPFFLRTQTNIFRSKCVSECFRILLPRKLPSEIGIPLQRSFSDCSGFEVQARLLISIIKAIQLEKSASAKGKCTKWSWKPPKGFGMVSPSKHNNTICQNMLHNTTNNKRMNYKLTSRNCPDFGIVWICFVNFNPESRETLPRKQHDIWMWHDHDGVNCLDQQFRHLGFPPNARSNHWAFCLCIVYKTWLLTISKMLFECF